MNAAGFWKVSLATAMGPQVMQFEIIPTSAGFLGRITSAMANLDVNGTVSGDKLSWIMNIKKPIPINVTFNVVVDGDAMTGTAKMGFFGKSELTGERIEAGSFQAEAAADDSELLTEDYVDPQFTEAYVDINELRGEPVPHRYVHGGFKDTDAKFSFYFPPAEQYQRRFFHNTYPMATTSDIGPFPIAFDVAMGNLAFTMDSGAYYVQTNLGGADRAPPADPAIAAYRVNAAAAKYSRQLAAELYGEHRPYGYLFGGSGGSYQVMGAAENTSGVWDGYVPFVAASPNAIPSMFTVRMHALRVLRQRNKFPGIVDAINPGGSGDPYVDLNEEESAALREASLMGYPLKGWWNHETLTSGYFPNVAVIVPMLDPTYLDDFWTKPGYLGTDPKSAIAAERGQFETTVAEVLPGFPAQIRLAAMPEKDFSDAHLIVLSGAAEGKNAPLADIKGDVVTVSYAADATLGPSLQPGDKVRFDNSWALALQTYQRHQLPTPDMYGWNQYRDANGEPLYPQREALTGPIGAAGTAGSVPDGSIHGKVLLVESMMDIDAMPWQADWYRSQVKEKLGAAFEDNFALWFIEHAQHDNPPAGIAQAHTVSFEGALQQALRDVSRWVEKGIHPSETQYEVVDTQVLVPDDAKLRGGIQPVVKLQVNGGIRTDVAIDSSVDFSADIEVPARAGRLISVEWDFEGRGDYPQKESISAPVAHLKLSTSHRYDKPGTYFAVVRATSQRDGDAKTPYGRIQNIARVRVVVS
ncbi:hypothetical protein [Zhongshania sp.]|uniref:hypothetical protein n=1 Tax=Zhongshania sp. TaxID=1971902 RepID=UPI003562AAB1